MNIWLRNPQHSPALINELADALPVLVATGRLLNDRNGQSTTSVDFAGKRWIVKRYQKKGWSCFLPRFASRPYRAFRASLHVSAAGVQTPSPLLLASEGNHLFSVTEQIDAAELFQVLRDADQLSFHRLHVLTHLPTLLARLSAAHITHGDLHPRNLLIAQDGTLWLIDLDGARKHLTKRMFTRRRAKDEHRLGKSLDVSPDLRDGLGFRYDGHLWRLCPSL